MIIKPSLGEIISVNYRQHPRYQGVAAHWVMAEGGGATIYDYSGFARQGSLGASTAAPSWANSGRFGHALTFDGSNDFIQATLNLSDTAVITLSFWLYWDTYGTDDDLAFEHTAAYFNNNGFIVDPNEPGGGGRFFIGVGGTAGNLKGVSIPRPTAAAWHHHGIVMDRTSTDKVTLVVVDGVPQTLTPLFSGTVTGNFANSTLNFMCRNGASLFGAGRLDDVRVYNRALSHGEILSLYIDPWLEFDEEEDDEVYFIVSGGDISASLTATLAGLSGSIAGAVAIAASVAKTLGALTAAAAGTVDVKALVSKTLGDMTADIDTAVAIAATVNQTLGALTSSAEGDVEVKAALSGTLGDLSRTIAGQVAVVAVVSKTLGDAVLAAEGVVGNPPIIGTLNKTLDSLLSSAEVDVQVQAALNITLAPLTGAATGKVDALATLAKTLEGLSAAIAAEVDVSGSVSKTLASLSGVISGAVDIRGELVKTLGALGLSSAGVVGDAVAEVASDTYRLSEMPTEFFLSEMLTQFRVKEIGAEFLLREVS